MAGWLDALMKGRRDSRQLQELKIMTIKIGNWKTAVIYSDGDKSTRDHGCAGRVT